MKLALRGQLVLQVTIGVASVVAMVLLLRAFVVQEEIDRAARGRLAVGRVLANYVDAQLGDQLQFLARASARLPEAGRTGAPAVLEDLRSRLDPTAYGVFLLDGNGSPIAAEPAAVGVSSAALVQRPEVAESLRLGRAAVSAVHSGPGGRAQFGIVVPARFADGSPAALGALVDPTSPRFTELVDASMSIGGRTSAEVVDQHGTVVASTQRERTLLPGLFPDVYMPLLRDRKAGTAEVLPTPDADGRHLIAFVPLKNAPWGLALGGPESEILAPIRRWDQLLAALALATLIVLVGLASLTARSIVAPIRTLIGAAGRIARGDLDSAVPRAGGGELMQLSTALDEMRRGLRDAQLARDEVDRLKDEFISSVSHELRTPLGYVKGYTTTLLRRDAYWDEETTRGFLQIIDESSDQLLELVDHLLDMSRIAEGKLSVSPEPLALVPLAQEVARKAAIRSTSHRIVVAAPPNAPDALADRERIMQVLGNLLDNAIKYSPDGGTIEIGFWAADDAVVVSVSDEGIGIPEDHLAVVFDRFHRGSDGAVRKIRGVGLGLPICRGIVEAHGGRIWAERAPRRGTTVRFTLPAVPDGMKLSRADDAGPDAIATGPGLRAEVPKPTGVAADGRDA